METTSEEPVTKSKHGDPRRLQYLENGGSEWSDKYIGMSEWEKDQAAAWKYVDWNHLYHHNDFTEWTQVLRREDELVPHFDFIKQKLTQERYGVQDVYLHRCPCENKWDARQYHPRSPKHACGCELDAKPCTHVIYIDNKQRHAQWLQQWRFEQHEIAVYANTNCPH
jgi:hypothetical protein